MRSNRWKSIVRSWTGPVAAALAVLSAVWLCSVYIHAVRVTPVDKALVDSLKEKAKTDLAVQKILQPEFDRQHEVLVRRRNAYNRGGFVLLIATGVFLAWFKWFRPGHGGWVGGNPAILGFFEKLFDAAGDSAAAAHTPHGVETREFLWNRISRHDPLIADKFVTRASLEPDTHMLPIPAEVPATGKKAEPDARIAPFLKTGRKSETGKINLGPVEDIIKVEGKGPEATIPILQAIQTEYRYLPEAALQRVCEETNITPSQIAGVATFYGQFRQTPVGEHIIRVCEGTACHVSGAVEVGNELRRCLGIGGGCDTDSTGSFTVERVACVGSCSLAPVITIDEKICGHVSALSASRVLADYMEAEAAAEKNGNGRHRAGERGHRHHSDDSADRVEIRIGVGSCGIASGAQEVRAALEDAVALLDNAAFVKPVGCSGLCHHEPLVEVIAGGRRVLYGNVVPEDVRQLVRKHVRPRGLVSKVREEFHDVRARLLDDSAWASITKREIDPTPYVQKQVRVVLENCGEVDPLSLEDYRKRDGMRAIDECLKSLSPEEVIAKVRTAGLRGRGGAGFPTATKWDITRRASGSMKYVICNGDEGDPGAFMDRAVLEADPFRVIEGLIIAAYAIGASEGFIYVRREYPIAVRHIRAAIARAEEAGFLGERILGTDFSFKLQIREGAGAFVCGEETALIQSIEGKRGMPRPRPPYPAQSGLWGSPTLINNVETLACLPWIIRNGPEAFAAMGTEKSKGTKVFSLAGKVNRGGLIEVPMGITIREIVEEIGGGIKGGRNFKAVLAGGPSGGCIPARLAETRIDYEELASTGAIVGSGGLVVLDDRDCAVEIARYFLHFTQNESCGKCTFCRIGTKRMLEILERICAGKGREGDLQTLEDLSIHVKTGSLCGLGQTAPNPVLTTMRYFREEYEAHIREGRCPAAACKSLIHFRVLKNCTGCTLCAQACPVDAIQARPYVQHEVKDDLCTRCGMCVTACPENAIEVA